MLTRLRTHTTALLAAACLAGTACGGSKNDTAAAPPAAATTTAPTSGVGTAASPGMAAPSANLPATPATPEHHSKLGGAVAGGVVGHMVGGRKGALAGAAAGALIQHHRNKVARQQAAAGTP